MVRSKVCTYPICWARTPDPSGLCCFFVGRHASKRRIFGPTAYSPTVAMTINLKATADRRAPMDNVAIPIPTTASHRRMGTAPCATVSRSRPAAMSWPLPTGIPDVARRGPPFNVPPAMMVSIATRVLTNRHVVTHRAPAMMTVEHFNHARMLVACQPAILTRNTAMKAAPPVFVTLG